MVPGSPRVCSHMGWWDPGLSVSLCILAYDVSSLLCCYAMLSFHHVPPSPETQVSDAASLGLEIQDP